MNITSMDEQSSSPKDENQDLTKGGNWIRGSRVRNGSKKYGRGYVLVVKVCKK